MRPVDAGPVAPRRRVLLYWALLQQLSRKGRALIVDSRNGLVERVARERGLDVSRVPSRAHLERHGQWIEPWLSRRIPAEDQGALGFQPVLLGSEPGYIEYQAPVYAGLRTLPAAPTRIPVESLDEMTIGLKDVRFIHLNDAHHTRAILEGGQRSIAANRPLISFSGLDQAACSAVMDVLVGLGYQFFDSSGRPKSAPNESVDWIAAAGADQRLLESCQRLMDDDERRDVGRGDILTDVDALAARLGATGAEKALVGVSAARSRVLTEAASKDQVTFRVGDLPGQDWYPCESDEVNRWRWSGPNNESRLLLPVCAPGVFRVRIRAAGLGHPSLGGQVRLFIDGRFFPDAGKALVPGADVELEFSVPPEEWNGAAEMLIALPYTRQPNPNDPRHLGLALDRLGVQWRSAT